METTNPEEEYRDDENYSNEQMYRSLEWLAGELEKQEYTNEFDITYKEVAIQALERVLTEMD